MDKIFAVLIVIFGFIILGSIGKELFSLRGGNNMAGTIGGATTTISANMNGGITLGGSTTTSVTVNSPMVATKTMWVGDEDVGENIKLFRFFLQSRYPEVFEEFHAIEKIKES